MNDVEKVVAHVRLNVKDLTAVLSDPAYEYASLGLCVIDAVFSIGVRYESTERTVNEFCARFKWQRDGRGTVPERTIRELVDLLQPFENRWDDMATNVFRNHQRTSARSGILKAEAVYRFTKILHSFGVESFVDVLKFGLRADLRQTIKMIPGQGSGLSYAYFLILAGHQDGVKADRMVIRFVANALGVPNVSQDIAEHLVRQASVILQKDFPTLVPSVLDNKIWKYQRDQENVMAKGCRTLA